MRHPTSIWLIIAWVLLAAAIFAIDVFLLPLGIAAGVPYVAVVLVSLWFPRRQYVLYAAIAATALTILGYFWSDPLGIPWIVLSNRFLALFAIWVTATVGYRRKRAEEDLRRSEQRLLRSQAAAHVGTWDWDLHVQRAACSDEYFRLYGVEPSEQMPTFEQWKRWLHPDDRERAANKALAAPSEETPYEDEFRVIWPDGSVHWLSAKGLVIRDEIGKPVQMIGVNIDIDERKEADQALQESEAQLRAILKTAAEAIITIDGGGTIINVNAAAQELFGYTADEMTGHNVKMLMPSPYHEEHDQYLARYHETGEARIIGFGREVIAQRKNGSIFPIDLAVSEVADLGLFTGFIRDITGRKEAEKRIEQYQHELRSSAFEVTMAEERERRRLAQDLHDGLSQTLVAIKLKLTALDPSTPATKMEESIRQVTDLLGTALRGANTLTFELSPPILYELGFVAGIRWLAKDMRKRFDLNVELDDDGHPKLIEETISIMLFRSVRELLMNVVKHAQAEHARVALRAEGDTLRIRVEDDGIGFDPGARGSRGEQGGFGLFSMRERLTHLGGDMEIHSLPGRGTTVALTVPLST